MKVGPPPSPVKRVIDGARLVPDQGREILIPARKLRSNYGSMGERRAATKANPIARPAPPPVKPTEMSDELRRLSAKFFADLARNS